MSATQTQHLIFGSTWPQENMIIKYCSLQQSFQKVPINTALKINNWSCAIPYKDNEILITGGLGNTNKIISNDVYLFNTQTNQLSQFSQFTQSRYVHQCVSHNDKVYVLGGRQYGPDFESVLSHCEVYEGGVWKTISPMTKRRSNFGVFIYNDQIYCIGGFDGKKNTKSIEYYDEVKNIWVRSKIRMPRGLAGFHLIPLENEKIMIVGGMTLQGPSQACIVLNLKNNTCVSYSQLNQIRSLFHMFRDEFGNYIVYGGMNKQNTFELFNYENKIWEEFLINMDENVQEILNQNLRGMSSVQQVCRVENYQQLMQQKQELQLQPDDVVFMFGNDEYPFILPLPKQPTENLNPLEVPTQLCMYSYMSVCSIDAELPNCRQILLAGGIDSKISQINKKAYLVTIIFPEMKVKVKKVGKLSYHRYAASCVYNAPYVYFIGGRGYQNDVLSLHSTVERFNIDEEEWDQIAPLNEAKCSMTANVIGEKIYVFGGYVGEGQISHKIECYNEQSQEWDVLNIELPFSLEGLSSIVIDDQDLFIFGGKGFDGSKKEIIRFNLDDLESNQNVSGQIVGTLQHSRSLPKPILLDDKNVLIIGGYFFDNPEINFGEMFNLDNPEDSNNEYANQIELAIIQMGANDSINLFSITN
ncbi:unnamed protein product (macronuclear) [Paramecium tetraurelia]|uniref:Kelch motif family protein n=1 Tax=Paramecium tetraurelia TaxID=5888 RepID=A0DI55_PARTE|nr:uncharacterized protein GSPATT00017093001 [Paramecium tetraurelia]CAK82722.1 unnamed protein product [Paramecium tetraurelia]|eukprot:XP_001450119.1 hypothetical protein (macronuclear) [Paramecium tetraurelia strain d4-2]